MVVATVGGTATMGPAPLRPRSAATNSSSPITVAEHRGGPLGAIRGDLASRNQGPRAGSVGGRTDNLANRPAELERFREGDELLMRAAYEECAPRLRRHLEARGFGDRVDTEGIIHDLFERLLTERRLRQKYKRGKLLHFLMWIVGCRAKDARRRADRLVPAVNHPVAHLTSAEDVELRLDARRFADKLPAGARRLFVMRYIERRTQQEAAAELGMARSTLQEREQQIREHFISYLRDERRRGGR